MNGKEFQEMCRSLREKRGSGELVAEDIDAFADVVTNILGRDDLKADGTEFSILWEEVDKDYVSASAPDPLLARTYEVCRLYSSFRFRPLTEDEVKKERDDVATAKKHPLRISIEDGGKIVASCWWEDAGGADVVAKKIAVMAPILPKNWNEPGAPEKVLSAFAQAGGGLDPLDSDAIESIDASLFGEVPISSDSQAGIAAIDAKGVERNRMRGASDARVILDKDEVVIDAYVIYGRRFFEELAAACGEDGQIIGELEDGMTSYPISRSEEVATKWAALGDAFDIPGSTNLVGAKKPLPAIRRGR